jgi:hypothetical protein
MKLFGWTSNKVVDTRARELAQRLFVLCPQPKEFSKKKSAEFEKRIDGAMRDIFAQAKAFRAEHGLGIFKRARFAKIFQDELMRQGYDGATVGKVTTALVTAALSGK